jgi:hypothetical protein
MFDPTIEAINSARSIVSSIFDLTPGVSLERVKDAFLQHRFMDVAEFQVNDAARFKQSLEGLSTSLCRQMAAQMIECGAHNVVFALKDVRLSITSELLDQSVARLILVTQSVPVAELSQQFLEQPALNFVIMPEAGDAIHFWKSIQDQFAELKSQDSYRNNPMPILSALALLESSFALRTGSIETGSFRAVDPVLSPPNYPGGYTPIPGTETFPIAA